MTRLVDGLLLLVVFTVTWAKLHWSVAGDVSLTDVLTALLLLAFALEWLLAGRRRVTRSAAVAGGFALAFLLVFLVGFFNLETAQALAQWAKGLVKSSLQLGLLLAAIVLLTRRGERLLWRTLGALCAGIAANALYGVAQLGYAEATDGNLDELFVRPVTGGASAINIYGGVEGESVYRPNALTGDPNHLGVELIVPLLVLTPLYLRLERGHRLRVPLAVLLAFLLVVELATLSRSGLLGLGVGALVLALPYRHKVASAAFLVPLGAVAAAIAIVVAQRAEFFSRVVSSRLQTDGGSTSVHFEVYSFIPDVLASHPLFGLGLNNFSVYYEFVTGKTNWGPHSFYVALLVERGLIGTLAFAAFLGWLFARAGAARAVGRALAHAGDAVAARVRPLAWGLTAALAGTLASNAFYLTMTFYYFYILAALIVAAPVVFARRL